MACNPGYNARGMNVAKPRAPGMVVLGDITVDILARMEAFAGLGEDSLVPELALHCGGVGANTALAPAGPAHHSGESRS